MKYFINESFDNGMNAYLEYKNNGSYKSSHIYELYVIDILVRIYGEISIYNPYKTGSERSLKDNLKAYGLDTKDVSNFIYYMDAYGKWLDGSSDKKSSLTNNIEFILIKMILLKNLYVKISNDDLDFFTDFFHHKDSKINKIVSLSSDNPLLIGKVWDRKKNIYLSNRHILFEEIEPDLLTSTMYRNHGLTINEIKQLSNIKVEEVNNMILADKKKKEHRMFNTFSETFSSGSGFVDTLVLLSIMFTEIMIGFIIAVTIARLK